MADPYETQGEASQAGTSTGGVSLDQIDQLEQLGLIGPTQAEAYRGRLGGGSTGTSSASSPITPLGPTLSSSTAPGLGQGVTGGPAPGASQASPGIPFGPGNPEQLGPVGAPPSAFVPPTMGQQLGSALSVRNPKFFNPAGADPAIAQAQGLSGGPPASFQSQMDPIQAQQFALSRPPSLGIAPKPMLDLGAIPPLPKNMLPFGPGSGVGADSNADPFADRYLAIEEGYGLEQRAARAAADAGAAEASQEHGFREQQADLLEHSAMRQEALATEHHQHIERGMSELQALLDDYSTSKVVEKEPSMGQIIAVLMGGIGAGLTGGPNVAAEMVQKKLDQSINLQRLELEKKKGVVGIKQNLLGMMREQMDDDDKAEAATRVLMLNSLEERVKAAAAQWKSPQAIAAAEAQVGALEVAKQNDIMKYQALLSKAFKSNPSVSGDWRMDTINTRVPEKERATAIKELAQKKQQNEALKALNTSFDQLRDISFIDQVTPFSPKRSQASSARSAIMLTLQSVWKGPMSDQDTKRAEGLLPTASDTRQQVEAKRDAFMRHVRSGMTSTPILDAYGLSGRLDAASPTPAVKGTPPAIKQMKDDVGTSSTSTSSPVGKVYRPTSAELQDLIARNAGEGGFDPSVAQDPFLHSLIARESKGIVGNTNFKFGRNLTPEAMRLIRDKVVAGASNKELGVTSRAIGLGQLEPENMALYAPSGVAGYGDADEEMVAMLRYIKARYGTPEVAIKGDPKKGIKPYESRFKDANGLPVKGY